MKNSPIPKDTQDREPQDFALTDEDIFEAMAQIPGYLDISAGDFRALYLLSHRHAVQRLTQNICASSMLRRGMAPLTPDLYLDQAARLIVASGYKGLPVVDQDHRVIGILTETDYLQRLNAQTFLEFMLRLLNEPGTFTHRCHEERVAGAMTAPAVVVSEQANFQTITVAFRHQPGRSLPVVDAYGRFQGLLLRKDMVSLLNLAGYAQTTESPDCVLDDSH